jgi:hypothetical protein
MFDRLPRSIKEAAKEAFKLFIANPDHPSLHHHALHDSNKGRHKTGSHAVHITRRACAIYAPSGSFNVWYWIGTHEDYNNFVGK